MGGYHIQNKTISLFGATIIIVLLQITPVYCFYYLDPWFTFNETQTGLFETGQITYHQDSDTLKEKKYYNFSLTSKINETVTIHMALMINEKSISYLRENTSIQHTFPASFNRSIWVESSGIVPQTFGVVLYKDGIEVGRHIQVLNVIARTKVAVTPILDKKEYEVGEKGVLTLSYNKSNGFWTGYHYWFQRRIGNEWGGRIYPSGVSVIDLAVRASGNTTVPVKMPDTPGLYRIVKPLGNGEKKLVSTTFSVKPNNQWDHFWYRFNYRVFYRIFSISVLISIIYLWRQIRADMIRRKRVRKHENI